MNHIPGYFKTGLAILLAAVVAPAAGARPNVIVILVDDLGCGDTPNERQR